ncbi:penicillin-binding protein 1C [Muricauda sp. DJ-13]|uniref:peptidoglycan glycosyltransferase n=1 Tax=Croceivirga thetidis TaxID=2721623 RepID=A0ABX1GS67_9FLAO|nr:penicillin-binding protein 1C [Croceivirga thetidis]
MIWNHHRIKLLIVLSLFLVWLFCLPRQLFDSDYATVVESKEGILLGARIADDGQWRFPPLDSVPKKFEASIRYFEDEHFYQHPGFNPISIAKALWSNITTDSRRGGSTLTQQVIRLSRQNKKRTYGEKLVELCMATRLEAKYSKAEILNLYASHAPFGGNVVGLDAASWRYFGVPAHKLSWGQTTALAVLPNAPSLIFPGTKDEQLRQKRNRLLKKLLDNAVLDSIAYELALEEPLPKKPLRLPETSPHLVELLRKEQRSKRWKTSIDFNLQQQCNRLVANHHLTLQQNQIHNLAVLVLDIENRNVLAYVGNAQTEEEHDPFVDIIQRNRSTGSVLKPLLFTAALQDGIVLPRTLVEDIPTVINGYTPENFDGGYDGAVPVDIALSRSLNVPSVRLLRNYGLEKFYKLLPETGITSLDKPASHYGLSMILGGAESSLWQLTNAYAGMARTLNFFNQTSSEYSDSTFEPASFLIESPRDEKKLQQAPVLNAGAVYNVFESLKKVNRPTGQENWSFFNESQPLAWKTGTSFGFKDAWAVGVTPKYAIGVWAGNADGEGRPGLTGLEAAAPLLFDVLERLPNSGWFDSPYDELIEVKNCAESGFLATPDCENVISEWVPKKGVQTKPCPYHSLLQLDSSERYQVTAECYPLEQIHQKSWFTLPPVLAYYYGKKHPEYRETPSFLPGCQTELNPLMQFIFPEKNETILLPREFGGGVGEVVFKLAHQQPTTVIFWYLDDQFIGTTNEFHELAFTPEPGDYLLSVIDEKGNRLEQRIKVGLASE